ncbi:MAG: diguanylate cyclase [Anaerolineaceae bacterium]|nr:diguanylate cyclase [Anaerolineaceae bacterium]
MLTTKSEKADILTGLKSGANDYIKKSFDNDELYARIRVGQRTIDLQASLYEVRQTLAHLATHDLLTGIMNRRAILEQLIKELARARRINQSGEAARLSIGFIDIDRFKQINDKSGQQAGDEVLKWIAKILTSQLQAYDTISRLCGDEFVVVAVGTDEINCKHLFEILLAEVSNSKIMTGTEELPVSVSKGVTQCKPDDEVDQFLEIADAAMFKAKRDGGNRVVCVR